MKTLTGNNRELGSGTPVFHESVRCILVWTVVITALAQVLASDIEYGDLVSSFEGADADIVVVQVHPVFVDPCIEHVLVYPDDTSIDYCHIGIVPWLVRHQLFMAVLVSLNDRASRLHRAATHPPLRYVHGECAYYASHPDTVHFRPSQVRFDQLGCLDS